MIIDSLLPLIKNIIISICFVRRTLVFGFSLWFFYASYGQSFVRFYPGAVSPIQGININSVPTCLEKTSDGGFLIGGYSMHPDTLQYEYMQLRKIDAQGNVIWEKLDRVGTASHIKDIVTADGNAIYCAVEDNGLGVIIKRTFEGDILWSLNLNTIIDTCIGINRIIKVSDGTIVISGYQNDCFSLTSTKGYIAKVDTTGMVIWSQVINNLWPTTAIDILQIGDTSLLVAGYTEENDNGQTLSKIFIANLNCGNGKFNWLKSYGNAHQPFSLTKTTGDTVIVAGVIYNNNPFQNSSDGMFFLLTDTGNFLKQIIDTVPRESYVKRVGYYKNSIITLQYISDSDTSRGLRVVEYSSADLSVIRSKSFSGYGSRQAVDMEILEDGRIAITFFETNENCNGCTGFAVIDSTLCIPEWCFTNSEDVLFPSEVLTTYPNPFTEYFAFSGTNEFDFTLYDVFGNVILVEKNVREHQKILTSELPVGIYFIQLQDKYHKELLRIIKLVK